MLYCARVVHSDTHTHEQFLNSRVGLGLGLAFVLCVSQAYRFTISVFFCVSLDQFIHVLLAFCDGFSFVSTIIQQIG